MAIKEKAPELAVIIHVPKSFIHCAKCIMQSDRWYQATWVDTTGMAFLAQIMINHGKLSLPLEGLEEIVAASDHDHLY